MKLLKHQCCSCTSFATLVAALFLLSGTAHAASFYLSRPADPRAVDFTAEAFGAHADGIGDDSYALQRAIDRVQETTGAGVLLIPEGRYRLSKTVHVWQGIRLLGYGATRPSSYSPKTRQDSRKAPAATWSTSPTTGRTKEARSSMPPSSPSSAA
jgi:hypothetical protein